MVQLYVKLIKEGLRTIDQVPEGIKAQVQAILDAEA